MAGSQTLRKEPHSLQALKGPLRTPAFLPQQPPAQHDPDATAPERAVPASRPSPDMVPETAVLWDLLHVTPTRVARPVAFPWSLRSRGPPSAVDEAPAPSLSGRRLLSPAADSSGALLTGFDFGFRSQGYLHVTVADRFWVRRAQFTETYVHGPCPARHAAHGRAGVQCGDTVPARAVALPSLGFQ